MSSLRPAAGEDEAEASAGAETDYADAVVDVGAGPQEVEAAVQVADGLGVGAGIQGVAGRGHVLLFHHRQESVAAVQGGNDGSVAQSSVATGHVLHVLLVAVDAVDEEQAGMRAAFAGPGHVGRHGIAVVAFYDGVVGGYVRWMIDRAGRQNSGDQRYFLASNAWTARILSRVWWGCKRGGMGGYRGAREQGTVLRESAGNFQIAVHFRSFFRVCKVAVPLRSSTKGISGREFRDTQNFPFFPRISHFVPLSRSSRYGRGPLGRKFFIPVPKVSHSVPFSFGGRLRVGHGTGRMFAG